MSSTDQTTAVECLQALEAAGIQTCLFHDRAVFDIDTQSDLDVVVGTRDLRVVARVLDETLREAGGRLVQGIRHESSACYFVGTYAVGSEFRFLKFDVAVDYRAAGVVAFGGREFMHSRVSSGMYWLSSVDMRFAYYLSKRLIKADIGPDQQDYLIDLYSQDADGCDKQMRRLLAPRYAARIKQALSESDWTVVISHVREIRRNLRWKSILNHPIGCAAYWPREFVRRIQRVVIPTGLWVTFLGPDGSGKSTVLTRIEERFKPAFRLTCDSHLRPGIIGPQRRPESVTTPHALPARGIVGSVAKIGLIWTDYIVGYFVRIRPRLVRSTLVLFDRCFHDLEVDPLRYRYGGPRLLAVLAARVAPRPALFLILDAPTDILQARKLEVTSMECDRQRAEYQRLAARLQSRAVTVDVSTELDDVVDQVSHALLTLLAKRMSSRWGLRQ